MAFIKARRCMEMLKHREERLLIAAEPLALAERICRRLVGEVDATTDGTLLLHANPALAGAINTVLVK
jgi:hypothetical protein